MMRPYRFETEEDRLQHQRDDAWKEAAQLRAERDDARADLANCKALLRECVEAIKQPGGHTVECDYNRISNKGAPCNRGRDDLLQRIEAALAECPTAHHNDRQAASGLSDRK